MFRKINILVLLVLGALFIGCRACYSPYDRCQPTFVPERGDVCKGELYRSGSVFMDPSHETDQGSECKECGGVSGDINDYKPSSLQSANSTNYETPANPMANPMENNMAGKSVPVPSNEAQYEQTDSPLWSLTGASAQDMNAVNEFNLKETEN